jgi:hypothetical protein
MSGPQAVAKTSTSPTRDSEKPTPTLSVVANDATHMIESKPSKNAKAVQEVSVASERLQLLDATDVETQTTEKSMTDSGQPPDKPPQHASSNEEHGIYLRSPVLMISCWIFGAIFSLVHHLFYSHFDGSIVGSTDEQQWNIRFVFHSTS